MIEYRKEFLKCLASINPSKRRFDIFKDFLELITLSFLGVFDKQEENENRYKEIIKTYKNPDKLPELLYITVEALTHKTHDFLGEIYMFGEFGNKGNGQFFTPYLFQNLWQRLHFTKTTLKQRLNKTDI